jgi:MFS transporter, ACS family, hexuronate transporter
MKPSRRRWLMIAFAFAATMVNYLDRQTLSVAVPVIRQQFHMSNVGYSHVLFAFLLAYTALNGISGPLIDRLGTRIGYALTMAWWSLAAVCHAFAHDVWSLGICRLFLGMGEAGNWPAAVKVVSEWFPERERALASGIFNSGSAFGAVLAPPLVTVLLLHYGWRFAFVAVGLAGFVWLALWLPMYRTPAPSKHLTTPLIPVRQLVRSRFVRSFTLSKVLIDPVWYFYIFWFPEYLANARHYGIKAVGEYGWVPFLFAGFGNVLGGLLAKWLLERGVSVTIARKVGVTIFAVAMAGAIPAVLVQSAWAAIAWISVAAAGYTGMLSNILAAPADVFPATAVASVYGIASMGSGFGGMVFSLITGWVVDHYSYTPVFIGYGVTPLIGALIWWAMMGPLCPHGTPTENS